MGFFSKAKEYFPPIALGKTIYQAHIKGDKKKASKHAAKGVAGGLILAAPFIPGAGVVAGRVATTIITKPLATLKTLSLGLGGAGLISSSPTVRRAIKKAPTTLFKGGEALGKTIEGKPPTTDLKTGLKAGGLVGGAAALIGGTMILKDKVGGKTLEIPKGLPTKDVVGSNIPAPSKSSLETPVSAVQKPTTTIKEPKPINVSQSVDVNVRASGITKRFKNNGVVIEA